MIKNKHVLKMRPKLWKKKKKGGGGEEEMGDSPLP